MLLLGTEDTSMWKGCCYILIVKLFLKTSKVFTFAKQRSMTDSSSEEDHNPMSVHLDYAILSSATQNNLKLFIMMADKQINTFSLTLTFVPSPFKTSLKISGQYHDLEERLTLIKVIIHT